MKKCCIRFKLSLFIVTAVLLLTGCGVSVQDTSSTSQAALSHTAETSEQSTSSPLSAEEFQSAALGRILGGLIEIRNTSDLVFDLESEDYEKLKTVLQEAGLDHEKVIRHRYPQLKLQSEDAAKFNQCMKMRSHEDLERLQYLSSLGGSDYDSYIEDAGSLGIEYADYGISESDEYLSIVCAKAYPAVFLAGGASYFVDAYVFDKNTGEYLNFAKLFERIGSGATNEGSAAKKLPIKVEELVSALEYLPYLYSNTDSFKEFSGEIFRDHYSDYLLALWEKIDSNDIPMSSIELATAPSFYLDSENNVRVIYAYTAMARGEEFAGQNEDASLIDVLDLPVSKLVIPDTQISSTFKKACNISSFDEEPLAMAAYLGCGGEETLQKLQGILNSLDITTNDLKMISYYTAAQPDYTDFYMIIPKYTANVVSLKSIHDDYGYIYHTSGPTVFAIIRNAEEQPTLEVQSFRRHASLTVSGDCSTYAGDYSEFSMGSFADEIEPSTEIAQETKEFFMFITNVEQCQ